MNAYALDIHGEDKIQETFPGHDLHLGAEVTLRVKRRGDGFVSLEVVPPPAPPAERSAGVDYDPEM